MSEIIIKPVEIVQGEKVYPKNKFFVTAEKLTGYFRGKGITEGDRIILMTGLTPQTIFSLQALWNLGAVPVPVDPGIKSNELDNIKSAVSSNVVIDNIDLAEVESDIDSKERESSFKRSQPSVIIFTSGSSGNPKGVEHTFGNLYSSFQGYASLGAREDESWLASLPFHHIGGFSIVARSLFSGSKIVIPWSLKSEELYEAIGSHDPGNISLVPTMLKRFNDKGFNANASHKRLFIGGAGIEKELVMKAKDLGWRPYIVYGSTETASMVTALTPEDFEGKPNSSGKPLSGSEVKVYGSSGKENKPFVTGRIGVKSSSLMKGYLDGKKAETIDGFFLTQDTGFLDEEGYLYVRSRIDNIIISGGKNIDPVEIEKYILGIEGIKETIVIGKPDDEWGSKVTAFIVKKNPYLTIDKVTAELKSRLAPYKIPKEIIFIDEIPKNELGKINKKALLAKF